MANNYFFPDVLAKAMSKVDFRTQLEASLLSTTLIMAGLVLTTIYILVYIHTFPLWYKITVVINLIAGIIFMGSSLITTFQSYRSYLEVQDFQKQEKENK